MKRKNKHKTKIKSKKTTKIRSNQIQNFSG